MATSVVAVDAPSPEPGRAVTGSGVPVPAGASPRWGRWAWLFAAVWLVYLAYPASEALQYPVAWARVAALCALAAFAIAFVLTFIRARNRRRAGRPQSLVEMLGGLGLMAALLAAMAPVVGQDVLGAAMYIVVLSVMVLPQRLGWPIALGATVLVEALSRTVPGWEPDELLVAQLVLGAVAGWGVGQLLDRNVELANARETISELAVVAERERVGRDLHDILGHSLSVIAIKAELAGRLLEEPAEGSAAGGGTARARSEVTDIETLSRESLADVRRTVSRMRSVSLDGEIAAARIALDAAGVEADLPARTDPVPPQRRELFAWALREAVTNVIRHSGAERCAVTLSERSIVVEDDGYGGQDAVGGSGLAGLRARAEAAGAVLRFGSGRLGGVRLEVEIP